MTPTVARSGALALALALAFAPAPSAAIAPALLFMIKQIAQQAATSMVKDALLSGLSGMGCKGIALSNALSAFDLRRAGGGVGGLMGGLPKIPGAGALSMGGLPNGMGLPPGMGMPSGMNIPPEMAAKMGALMPSASQLPPGMAIDGDPMAMMARVQQMMGQPLSPPETLATIDELFELGFLPKAMQTELKECMLLVPSSIEVLGMGMGMIKPMIPQLRQARAELHALSPAEQDEVAATLTQQMLELPADQRAALTEHLDSGFFPRRISLAVKAATAAR